MRTPGPARSRRSESCGGLRNRPAPGSARAKPASCAASGPGRPCQDLDELRPPLRPRGRLRRRRSIPEALVLIQTCASPRRRFRGRAPRLGTPWPTLVLVESLARAGMASCRREGRERGWVGGWGLRIPPDCRPHKVRGSANQTNFGRRILVLLDSFPGTERMLLLLMIHFHCCNFKVNSYSFKKLRFNSQLVHRVDPIKLRSPESASISRARSLFWLQHSFEDAPNPARTTLFHSDCEKG